jgi:hypothetical protein
VIAHLLIRQYLQSLGVLVARLASLTMRCSYDFAIYGICKKGDVSAGFD